jgi:hypothetical protein
VELYLRSPIQLHGAMFNKAHVSLQHGAKLSTGTTLPLSCNEEVFISCSCLILILIHPGNNILLHEKT